MASFKNNFHDIFSSQNVDLLWIKGLRASRTDAEGIFSPLAKISVTLHCINHALLNANLTKYWLIYTTAINILLFLPIKSISKNRIISTTSKENLLQFDI